jgi:hypothetical protein
MNFKNKFTQLNYFGNLAANTNNCLAEYFANVNYDC